MRQAGRILLVILLGLGTVAALRLALAPGGVHNFTGRCEQCHVGLKNPRILTRDPDVLCLPCHADQQTRSHPSNLLPRRAVPARFPLYGGKMTCVTCHIAHRAMGPDDTAHAALGDTPYLLRYESAGKAFCFQCHQGDFLDDTVDSHAVAFQLAHSASRSALKDRLDANSRECLSCHDGTLSRGFDAQVAGVNWEHTRNIGLSHPIGVDYAEAYRKKPREYHAPGSLDPRLRLTDGKISCETCHDHYSRYPHLLVMENIRSRLCLSCHNL